MWHFKVILLHVVSLLWTSSLTVIRAGVGESPFGLKEGDGNGLDAFAWILTWAWNIQSYCFTQAIEPSRRATTQDPSAAGAIPSKMGSPGRSTVHLSWPVLRSKADSFQVS